MAEELSWPTPRAFAWFCRGSRQSGSIGFLASCCSRGWPRQGRSGRMLRGTGGRCPAPEGSAGSEESPPWIQGLYLRCSLLSARWRLRASSTRRHLAPWAKPLRGASSTWFYWRSSAAFESLAESPWRLLVSAYCSFSWRTRLGRLAPTLCASFRAPKSWGYRWWGMRFGGRGPLVRRPCLSACSLLLA